MWPRYPAGEPLGPRRRRTLLVALILVGVLLGRPAGLAPGELAWADERQPAVAPVAAPASAALLDTPAAELRLVDLINQLRVERGVPPLEVDDALVELARWRSRDMVERGYFSHEMPGLGWGPDWLLAELPGARGAGENLGLSDVDNADVLQALFDAWAASPRHLANMLQPQFTRIGVGMLEVPREGGGSLKVVTQVFAVADGPLSRVGP